MAEAAQMVSMSMNALEHFGKGEGGGAVVLELSGDISVLHLFRFVIHLPARGRGKKQWVATPSANLAG